MDSDGIKYRMISDIRMYPEYQKLRPFTPARKARPRLKIKNKK
jgi:hypothetical protein